LGLQQDMESGILTAGVSISEERTHGKGEISGSQMRHISLDRPFACPAVR